MTRYSSKSSKLGLGVFCVVADGPVHSGFSPRLGSGFSTGVANSQIQIHTQIQLYTIAQRDYILELGQARYQTINQERVADRNNWKTNSLGCWLWQTSLTTVGHTIGYARLRQYTNDQYRQKDQNNVPLPRSGGADFLLHRVAFVAHYGRNPTHVVSHLCNQKIASIMHT